MGPREIAGRLRDEAIKAAWRRGLVQRTSLPPRGRRPFAGLGLAADAVPLDPSAAAALVAAAEGLLAGRLPVFGREVALPATPRDWFTDPDTGLTAPSEDFAFDIDARNPGVVGNHKFLLEPSRLQHATVLASAYFVSGRDAFAELAADQIALWWRCNPFPRGVHWTSGIEVALRLVTFAWSRRMLEGWPGAADRFEGSELACGQIHAHLRYLGQLRSHGSSANNHLMAELLGLYVGAAAFPWFQESARWVAKAAAGLEEESSRQVFADGLSREQASEYHGFVLEMLMTAAVEGVIAGRPFSPAFQATIARMADALAATLDVQLRPPRQGDSDDAYVLRLDPHDRSQRPQSLLAAAGALVGPATWWPTVRGDLRSALFAALAAGQASSSCHATSRHARRPNSFPLAGSTILRDLERREDEIWCRCDHGPHGYLSISAHAHADALSIELRHGGVDILADPGTYCYLTEPPARQFFRSTIGHNTLEIGGADQAESGGPFLWLDSPNASLVAATGLDEGPTAQCVARHDGYARQPGRPVHERSVVLDRRRRTLEIEDRIAAEGCHRIRLAFHLGPHVHCAVDGESVELSWSRGDRLQQGRLMLPRTLQWRQFRGSEEPFRGWYSPAFGERVASTCWIGEGVLTAGEALRTTVLLP